MQDAKSLGGDRDPVAQLVRESLAGFVPVLDGREQGAEEEHEPVRILMMPPDDLRDEIQWIPADFRHEAPAFQHEPVLALDPQVQLGTAHVIHGIGLVEQADHGANGATRVVVLGHGKQES